MVYNKNMERILRKLFKLPKLLKCYFSKDRNALLALLEDEAQKLLKQYGEMGVCNIEGIEDLLFHIRTYHEIPEMLRATEFPMLKNIKFFFENGDIGVFRLGHKRPTVEELEEYIKYIEEVERQRAVERDFIFEKAKELPLEFCLC